MPPVSAPSSRIVLLLAPALAWGCAGEPTRVVEAGSLGGDAPRLRALTGVLRGMAAMDGGVRTRP